MLTVGFIGLGNMGGPMAENLVKAGFPVKGYDLSHKALDLFSAQGGTVVQRVEEVVVGADIVISMLPASQHVESLYCMGDKLLDIIKPPTLVIDASTIDATTAKKVEKVAHDRGIDFIDAPVSGGVAGAINGTLTFIVGGSEENLHTAKPVLEVMGSNIFLAGPVGSGQIAKACNNMLLAILMSGTAEALALGVANGLDVNVLSNIMSKSSGKNWALELYNPVPGVMENVPASRNYEGGFMTKLMLKDLGLALDAAKDKNASIPMGSLARNIYSLHASSGKEELDFSSIYQLFNSQTAK